MSHKALPELSVVLVFLREGQGWGQAELAAAAGISPKLLNDYERGRKTLTRQKLEHLISYMGLPPERIDVSLACLAGNRAAGREPRDSEDHRTEAQRRIEVVASRAANLAAGFARSILSLVTEEADAVNARQEGETLWRSLARYPSAAGRRLLVEKGTKYRQWPLCVRVAAESLARAANEPRAALELAELALLIAERLAGDAARRSRLQGYAWAHVANGRRVCQDVPGARRALAKARPLWEAGAAGDPGLLNPALLPWIEAAVHRADRRFPEALRRIDEALALDAGELRGKILLSKSSIFQILGDPEESSAALSEATPLIDAEAEPRLAFGLRFNLLVDLSHLEDFAEVERRLPEVRGLAERLGEELDLARTVWLQAKARAGLGRLAEAEAAFGQAREVFRQRELAYDYALVSLDLALLLLEQGRAAEVRALAEEMLWIFRAQEVEREVLSALRLFCDAARKETASVELALRLVKYLYRAQNDPELRFEAEDGLKPGEAPARADRS
jgi:transcriptional regulator with XRE-family HTH domain